MPTEADYLELQAAVAKARFRRTVRTMANEILAPLEIRPFIQRRPWWSLGGAAVGGFVCGRSLGRRRVRASALQGEGGRVHAVVASVSRRVRRILSSALSAIVVANLRGGTPVSKDAAANGATTSSEVA